MNRPHRRIPAAAFFLTAAALAVSAPAFAERNCPAGIHINSVSKNSNTLQDSTPLFEPVFTEVFKSRFGQRANVTSAGTVGDASRKEKERFDKIKDICDSFLRSGGRVPPECDMSPEAEQAFSGFGDFGVTISAHQLGSRVVITLRALQTAGQGSSVIANAQLNFTTAQTADGSFGPLLQKQLRPVAKRFADEFEKRFYCVELAPKSKKIRWEGRPVTIPYTAKAENLAGNPAGGEVKTDMWNEQASSASLKPTQPRFSGGEARSTYTMRERIDGDVIHITVTPRSGIPTGTTAVVETEKVTLCLSLEGYSNNFIDASDAGHGEVRWNSSLMPTPVPVDKYHHIAANGEFHITASTAVAAPEASGLGSGEMDDTLSIEGALDDNNVAHFMVKASRKTNYPVVARMAGYSATVMFPIGKFKLRFELPYEDGATTPVTDSGAGVVRWEYSYTATLSACN